MNEFFKNYLEKEGYNFYKNTNETLQINMINLEDELFDLLIEKFNLKEVGYADVLGCDEAVQVAAIGNKNNKEVLFFFYLSDYPFQEYNISYILECGEYAPLAENNSAKEELSPEEYKRQEKYLSPKNPLTIDKVEGLWEKL